MDNTQEVVQAITAKGEILKAKMETGVPLQITRILAGTGRTDDLYHMESLADFKQELQITGIQQRGTQAYIFAILTNIGLDVGYDLTRFALCALDPDEGEIIYKAVQLGRAIPISAARDFPNYSMNCTFTSSISNASTVNVVVDPSGTATIAQVQALQQLVQQIADTVAALDQSGVALPDIPVPGAKLSLKLISAGKTWKPPWLTDSEELPEGEPVQGFILTDDGKNVVGKMQLDSGELVELAIIPENGGK